MPFYVLFPSVSKILIKLVISALISSPSLERGYKINFFFFVHHSIRCVGVIKCVSNVFWVQRLLKVWLILRPIKNVNPKFPTLFI